MSITYLPEQSLTIGDRTVGVGHPPLLIAEIGINHNGEIERAKTLIRAAKKCGAHAVKFQKRNLEEIYTRDILEHLESYEQGFQYLIPILRRFELSNFEMRELKVFAESLGLLFLCTAFDETSAQFLHEIDLQAFKVSSADLTNIPLLEKLLQFQKPLLLSTGMSTEDEIEHTVGFLRKNSVRFALMHCVSCYPVDTQNAHLENVKHLAARYRCPVGYSGHDIGTSLSLVAVSLGACIIEKHFTLDRSMEGPDHRVSLLPEEFQRLAASLRTHKANGKRLFSKKPRRKEALLQGEQLNKQLFRKSVVAARPIRMGQIIGQDDLMLRCPGTGLSGQALGQLFGTPAAKDYSTEEIFFEIAPTLARSREEETFFEWGHGGLVVRYHDFETALSFSPRVLEFHLTYADTEREIPLEKFERFRDRLNGLKLRVHCCEYLGEQLFDLCTGYREVYKRSLRTLERVIEITHQLNRFFLDESPMIVFNCGAMTLKEDVRQVAIDRARFLRDLQHLSNHGIELLAQTMPPSPWYFGGQWKGHFLIDPQELRWYAQETGNGVCLDLSHAAMAAEYLNIPFLEYCQSLKPFVKHIHLSDARGIEDEGLQIGDGSIPFPQFFSEFQSFSGSWIPEIWQGHVNNHFAARVALKRLSESYLAGCKPENRIALLGNE